MGNLVLLYTGNASLTNGAGTERVFVNMANEFEERGYSVYAVTNDNSNLKTFFPLNPHVHFIGLQLRNKKLPFAIKAQREINRIVPFSDHPGKVYMASLAANKLRPMLVGKTIACIVCYEHEDVLVANRLHVPKVPIVAMIHSAIKPKLGDLNKWALLEENKVTVHQVLMPDFVKEAQKYVKTKIKYIPNAVDKVDPKYWKHVSCTAKKYNIITVGRLDTKKQTHVLIKAFYLLAEQYPNWNVYIYGKEGGGQKVYTRYLQQLIEKYNLQNRVFLCGVTKNVFAKLQTADIFAFPSAYEGFGLALAEAMSVGLPSVGYASAAGVNNLLEDGKTGVLCKDGVNPFSKGLEKLIKSPKLREKMGKNARESVKKYGPDVVWNEWEHLIQQLQDVI